MNNILHFTPKSHQDAKNNLKDFIEFCKPLLKPYTKVKSWDDLSWDLSGILERSPGKTSKYSISFSNFSSSNSSKGDPLQQPFLNFAKAYFLYSQATNPITSIGYKIVALRAIEAALIRSNGSADLEIIDTSILNLADSMIRQRYADASAYHIGGFIQKIGAFCVSNQLTIHPFRWKSSIPRARDKNRVGKEADEKRRNSLPSAAAMSAIPEIFRSATAPKDVIVSSIMTILCFCSCRISEALSLPEDCEVESAYDGKATYQLRWWPRKGHPPMLKDVLPSAVEIVKEAISRLRTTCSLPRSIAAWYESHPNEIYISAEKQHLSNKDQFTWSEINDLANADIKYSVKIWMRSNNIDHHQNLISRKILHQYFNSHRPKNFPFQSGSNLRLSQSLILSQPNFFHETRGTITPLIEEISISNLANQFGNPGHPKSSIFYRMGFREPDGNEITLSSHQFRRLLNTMAQRGGVSELEIAKWSGRLNPLQNRAYDKRSAAEFLEMTRELAKGDPKLFGGLGDLSRRLPVTRDEFNRMIFPTAHVTEIGFCIHDFVSLPCEQHRDCVNCNEHVCVKGDKTKTAKLKEQLELAVQLHANAVEEKSLGAYGASKWVETHSRVVLRLQNTLKILEDESVPEGSIIRLINPDQFDPLDIINIPKNTTSPIKITKSNAHLLG